MSQPYSDLPGFEHLYLEDSYVLGLVEGDRSLRFLMLFVLHEHHLDYLPPKKGEHYCYKRGAIIFDGVKSVRWSERNFHRISDPDDSADYGNIDAFDFMSGTYRLEGEWGEVWIIADGVSVRFDSS